MKRITTTFLLSVACLASFAQSAWIDMTDEYVLNPRFDNNDRTTGWSGTAFGAANPKENAEHYSKSYNTYQSITGLTAGKYRVSLDAFYRMGDATNDYSLYNSGNYNAYQYAKLYATSSKGSYEVAITPASSAALEHSLGGGTSTIGTWGWLGNGKILYIPNNMEAANYWFNAGYYDNSLECEVGNDGKLTIGIRKDKTIGKDWTCLDNWKLEYYGKVVNASSIVLSKSEAELLRSETLQLTAKILPEDATYRSLSWASTDESVAIVDNNGKVTAIANGTCEIIATSKNEGNISARCKINVSTNLATSENLVINEIMASNVDVYMDPSFNYGSWVELYNPTDKSVVLGGLYISNDPSNLKKNQLIDTYGVLPAHGYALLNFDHHEVWTKASYRQINDNLDYAGGTIIISDGTTILAQQDYPQAISRTSYARTTDGGSEWGTTGNPSPGSSNQAHAGFATEQLDAPTVDKNAQVFTGTLQIHVAFPEGTTLKYTTDGTTPTLSNGNISENGNFTIDKSTCYRFRVFKEGYLPSQVVTRSYIYDNNNYHFPIISVVTNPDNIYSKEYGVFESSPNGRPGNGSSEKRNWNMEWDRPVSFEYITKDNECIISQECNFAMCGGWSRSWSPHSFKLKANKVFDANNFFNAPLFEKKPYIKNKVLQIRNGGNDNNARIKDASIQQVVANSGLYVDYQEWQPVHVFLNGEHYAVLNMREPNNKHFAYSNYGLDTDLMDQFEMSPDSGYVQKEGTADAFLHLVELSENAAAKDTYKEICKLLDIDEYINYMAAEFYIGGTDWPQNNVKGFRDINDGKFHFVLFDLDFAGATSAPFDNFFGKQYYTFDQLMGYDYSINKDLSNTRRKGEIKFVTLFKNLLSNEIFRKKFIDTYCIIGGAVFQPKYVKSIVGAAANNLAQGGYVYPYNSSNEIINKYGETYNGKLTDQLKKCNYMLLSEDTKQKVSINANIDGAKIEYNGMELPYTEFNGYLFSPVTLKAVAPAGYKFTGWSQEAQKDNYVSTEQEYTLPKEGSVTLTAIFEKIDAQELTNHGITPIRVNEISAANSMYINDYGKKNDWIELYNTTDTDIDIAGMYLSDNIKKPKKYQIPTDDVKLNTIIPAHGYKVIWCDKLNNKTSAIHTSFKLAADGGDIVFTTKAYADTLTYVEHIGIQSYGRYPDGANEAYLMNQPTIGKANKLTSYDMPQDSPDIPSNIATVSNNQDITIAYVDGVINIKSDNSTISQVALYNITGTILNINVHMREGYHFATIPTTALPKGICIVKVTTDTQGVHTMKINVK